MVVQYHQTPDNKTLIINDIGRCASCHQPGWAAQDQILMGIDPAACGEFLEQRAIEAARGAIIDVLDRSLMTQSGIAQTREQAPVTSIADLLIEQQSEPFGMGQRGGFSGCFDLTEGLGHAVESELMKEIEGWMGEQGLVSLVVVARAADVGMEDRRAIRCLVRGVPIELVVEDGTDRSVGERADVDGARGGGFQTCDTERSCQAQDAKTGSEALLGVRPVLQDELAERCGCWPDEGGVSE